MHNNNTSVPVVLQVLPSDKALEVSGCSTFKGSGKLPKERMKWHCLRDNCRGGGAPPGADDIREQDHRGGILGGGIAVSRRRMRTSRVAAPCTTPGALDVAAGATEV
jgi:hypothetical protein